MTGLSFQEVDLEICPAYITQGVYAICCDMGSKASEGTGWIERNCVQLKEREMSTLKVSEIVLSAVCLGTQEALCPWFTALLFNNSQLVSTASADNAVPQMTPLVCNTSRLSICYQPLPLGITGNNTGPNSQNTLAQCDLHK